MEKNRSIKQDIKKDWMKYQRKGISIEFTNQIYYLSEVSWVLSIKQKIFEMTANKLYDCWYNYYTNIFKT